MLKSMKMSDLEKKEQFEESAIDRPSYPYGLKIHIDYDIFEKLELGGAPEVGAEITMLAKCVVTDVHQDKHADDKKKTSFGLQIQELDLRPETAEKEKKDATTVLYGE